MNVDNVTETIGLDKRISPLYLTGGPSFGGTCFPRDTKAYVNLARKNGIQHDLISAIDEVNEKQNEHIADLAINNATDGLKEVLILGTAFKEDTPVTENSVALKIIPLLLKAGLKVGVHDEQALEETKAIFGKEISYLYNKSEFFSKPKIIIAPIKSDYYKKLDYKKVKKDSIIDCWRFIDESELKEGVKYIPLGIGSR